MQRNRILLVEDEHKIAGTLKYGLEEHGYEVTIAPDGLTGKELFWNNDFDLVILDVNLPRKDGYSLCREIRSINEKVALMMLTAFGATENKLEGFESGADDYLVKPFEFKELLARIKVLLKRSAAPDEEKQETILHAPNLELNVDTREVIRSGEKIQLTAKECQLLEFFLRNPDKVVSRADISNKVWDIDYDTQTNITEVYMNFLRKKIDKSFSPKLLHTITGLGYMLKTDPDHAD